MPKFVIEREVPGAGKRSEAELREAVSKSLEKPEEVGPGDRWIQSWVTDDKIDCMYYAPDVEPDPGARSVNRRPSGPCSGLSFCRMVDPSNFE